jgi:hypothetical protein
VQVLHRPLVQGGQARLVSRLVDEHVHVLSLAAVPVRRHHHPARDRVRHRGAMLKPEQVQAGVDPGGGAGAGDHLARVDVEHPRIDLDGGIAAGKLGGVPPVRGRPAAVQQPGGGENERSGALTEHPPAAPDDGLQRLKHRRRRERVYLVPAHDDPQVGGAEPVQAGLHHDRQADIGAHRPRCRGHDCVRTGRTALGAAVAAEDLSGHAETEHGHAVVGQDCY